MSDASDQLNFECHDIWAAFSLLTRMPVPVDHARAGLRGAQAVWAYPVVGAVLGLVIGAAGMLLVWIGTPSGITAALILAGLALTTGAMHEDGLADCADGFGGGATRERRLQIMKDSRIGAFGAIALGIALIARWDGLEALSGPLLPLTLMAVGAASRTPMVLAMYFLQNARQDGLSASVGRPPAAAVSVTLILGLSICLLGTGLAGPLIFFWAILGALPVMALAQRSIGGQTGDVLGAAQQCAEIAALASAVAVLA